MAGQSQRLRIIAGEHRGRILNFTAVPGLRPTPDRVRETLFNWLQPVIDGASCLDLFAGSGALGLEAASRGAGRVVWVESNQEASKQIQTHVETLALVHAEVVHSAANQYLQSSPANKGFDIVFLDPPFNEDLLISTCQQLETEGWLKSGARIYLESEAPVNPAELPDNWLLSHQKQAGQVYYHLAVRE